MKKLLYVDCLIRKENSRTKKIADAFFKELEGYEVKHLVLEEENLKPLYGDFFLQREELLKKGELDHPRFRYAHEFADADVVVMAAPFWDLNFPALLKIYIENISVDGITFTSTKEGLKGLCKATHLIFFTSRGGIYGDNSEMETAIPYLKAFIPFYGFDSFKCIYADGQDVEGFDSEKELDKAINEAILLAHDL